jgi:hypothetical protein
MLENRLLDLPGGGLPSMADLPIFDLWGRLADDMALIERRTASPTLLPSPSKWAY